MTAADFFARWRVRLGYILAVFLLFLARPTPQSIALGGLIGVIGLFIRGYAAGFLHKQEVLTTTGPYAYTRNPLYFGSSFLALGAAIAMRSWIGGALLLIYFSLVYSFVMRREEGELRPRYTDASTLTLLLSRSFSRAFARKILPPMTLPISPGLSTRKTTNTRPSLASYYFFSLSL